MRRSYKGISINTSRNTHETVFSLVRKGGVVVDIPCGAGAFVQRLKDAGFSRVLAVDITNILEVEHADFLQGDMNEALPLADASCDTLVCIDGIEHISRQFDLVREAHRVLKPGGEIIISTPNISSLRSRWKWLMTGHHHKCNAPLDEHAPTPLHHIGMISFPEMRYLLHSNGFRINKVTTNRVKPISYLFGLLLPVIYVATRWAYSREGRREGTSAIGRAVLRTMFSRPVLFGETLIVRAERAAG